MKKSTLAILLVASSAAFAQTPTSDFTGLYAGVQVGTNHSKSSADSGISKRTNYPGLVAGYAVEKEGILVGVEAFADYHNDSTTYKDAGFGLKVGKVFSNVLVYGRLGTTGTWPSWRPQMGVGAEVKVSKEVGLTAFVSRDKTTDSGIARENNSAAVGVNYYFR
jgi:outer membrane immunogenic protein